jgi:hypothetical protein
MIPHKMKGRLTEEQDKARNKFLACVFLAGVNKGRYEKAMNELNNDFLLGAVSYPEDVPAMISFLSNRQEQGKYQPQPDRDTDTEVPSFVQETKICYCCGKKGHTSFTCPSRKKIARDDWWIKRQEKTAFVQTDDEDEDDTESRNNDMRRMAEKIGWNL